MRWRCLPKVTRTRLGSVPQRCCASSWGLGRPPAPRPHSLGSLNGNGIFIRCPHTPARQRLRDIPAPLFGPGSHPSLDGQRRRSLGGKFLSRALNTGGWGQDRRHAGPLRAGAGVGAAHPRSPVTKFILIRNPSWRGWWTQDQGQLVTAMEVGGKGLLFKACPPPSLGSASSAVTWESGAGFCGP